MAIQRRRATEGWKRGTLAACGESQPAHNAVGWTCLWTSVLALCPLKYHTSHVCPDNLVGMLHIALNILAHRPKPGKPGVRNRSRSSQSRLTPKVFTAHPPKSTGPGLPDCLQHGPGKCCVPASEEAVTMCQMPTSWHAWRGQSHWFLPGTVQTAPQSSPPPHGRRQESSNFPSEIFF